MLLLAIMILNKCCCCIDLRLGCLIFAVIGIILNAAFFGTIESLCLHPKTILFQKNLGCHPTFYVIALGSSIGILGNLCCLFGAIKSNKILVSIYLLAEGMRLGIYFAFAIQNFLIFDRARWPMWNLQLTAIKFPVAAQAESLRLASPRAIASAIISARQMYNLSLAHYSHRRL